MVSVEVQSELMLADDRLFGIAAAWRAAGHDLALAFVIRTWGSSPRQVGSLMLVRDDAQIAGSVSGGCVEGAVIDAGLEMIKSGGARRLDFGVADATAWEVGLSCGGEISILVMAVADGAFPPALLEAAANALAQRVPVGLFLPVAGGVACVADPIPATSHLDGEMFCFVQAPRPQIIIVGAVHISQHLAAMATQCGFDVTIIDPRRVFATAERFPGQRLILDWPDDVLADMVLDTETAMVALTHDPKIDDAALHVALRKPLFHIAALGSSRTHRARLVRLVDAGFDPGEAARIKGPAGLDIGAKTPAEIAVSVLAELVAAYRGRLG
jgi:xanthine dehydrogenase accessory factor